MSNFYYKFTIRIVPLTFVYLKQKFPLIYLGISSFGHRERQRIPTLFSLSFVKVTPTTLPIEISIAFHLGDVPTSFEHPIANVFPDTIWCASKMLSLRTVRMLCS